MFQGKLWNFQNVMSSSLPTKRISQIFNIGDIRSGHFCDLPIISQWSKKSTPLYLLWRKHIWVESYRIGQLSTIYVKICIAYPLKRHLRSTEVTNRHLPITFDQKKDRDVGLVSEQFASDGDRAKFQRPACSLQRLEHVTMVFECPRIIFKGQKLEKSFSGHMTSLTFDDLVVPWRHFKSS